MTTAMNASTVEAAPQTRISGRRLRAEIVAAALAIVFVLGTFAPQRAQAQTLTTLYRFGSAGYHDGSEPKGLVQGTDGNFYGTTSWGGAYLNGTIFKITPSGTYTTLYSFCAQGGCADGVEPTGALVQGTDGNFYGTTYYGGAYGYYEDGGTVFKITPSGTLTTLYSFCSQGGCTDGSNPGAGLVQGTDGNFYGTTDHGGAPNWGTVFKITPSGGLTTIHRFGGSDGAYPYGGLLRATDGNFYGTTYGNTVYKITPSGVLTTLYTFLCSQSGCYTDGAYPEEGLIQGTDGNFYGTTSEGGDSPFAGTIFKMTPSGSLTTLHRFCSQPSCADGSGLTAVSAQSADGNFYGTASGGGAYGEGTVFKITLTGTLTTLYSFCSQPHCIMDGNQPTPPLIQATDGNFYGTTTSGGGGFDGGDYGWGTVFKLEETPRAQIANLQGMVKALVSTGKLNAGQGQSLLAKLNAALDALDVAEATAAIQQMEAFINHVQALVRSRVLTAAQGQALILRAKSIITALGV